MQDAGCRYQRPYRGYLASCVLHADKPPGARYTAYAARAFVTALEDDDFRLTIVFRGRNEGTYPVTPLIKTLELPWTIQNLQHAQRSRLTTNWKCGRMN